MLRNGKPIILSLLVISLSAVILCSAASAPEDAATAAPQADGQAKAQAIVQPKSVAEPAIAEPPREAPVASQEPQQAAESKQEESEISKRKGKAATDSKSGSEDASPAATTTAPASTEKPSVKPSSSSEKPKAASSGNKSQLSGKSAPKSKLPANLGTVTSTGSGGPAHYMSKHDAYSAIAEKHGALAHEAMKKADKRQTSALHNYGGIQKTSAGLGDMLSPFKSVTDGGLARNLLDYLPNQPKALGASMRSIMKSKYSVPAYVASALLGAVALMAFYESPISPLPVPPLPEPPVGRFPPEMPSLPIGTQVPFRGSQQQQQQQQQYGNNYQRSFDMQQQLAAGAQVLFPGNSNVAQQRQMTSGAGPVQHLAANLLSKQNAQRKSSPDFDQASSRSFFGGQQITSKMSTPANQQKSSGSFLSYFGFGGSESPAPAGAAGASNQVAGTGQMSASSLLEPKAGGTSGAHTSSALSGSHLVNKMKSLFNRTPVSSGSASASSSISAANANPYDQYQRMSIMQAFMKDAAFLPAYLTPTRKSSSGNSGAQAGAKPIAGAGLVPAASTQVGPAARMQVGGEPINLYNGATPQVQQMGGAQAGKQKPSPSYGLVKAADRIAHALLETFGSGIMQRHAAPAYSSSQQQYDAKKSDEVSPLASASSLLSDIVTSYSSNMANEQQPSQQQSHHQQADGGHTSSKDNSKQLSSRSLEVGPSELEHSNENQSKQVAQAASPAASSSAPVASSGDDQQASKPQQQQQHQLQQQGQGQSQSASAAHVRKTRSIGLEYAVDASVSQKTQQPSKAAQINNVIDFVADSYSQNRLLFNFLMSQAGLSQAVPYVEQILTSGNNNDYHH